MANTIDKNTALKKAQYICAKQEKCKADIRQKLYEWKLEASQHSWVLEQLEKEKFIDEMRFTGFYVRDKFKFNKWGKIKIEHELNSKQINAGIIHSALETINNQEYENICEHILMQKLNSLKHEEALKLKEKMIRFGYSKGFEQDMVFRITEKLINLHKKDKT